MIISMKLHSTKEEIAEVTGIVKHFGYKVHSIEGEERVVIGVGGSWRCNRLHGIRGSLCRKWTM